MGKVDTLVNNAGMGRFEMVPDIKSWLTQHFGELKCCDKVVNSHLLEIDRRNGLKIRCSEGNPGSRSGVGTTMLGRQAHNLTVAGSNLKVVGSNPKSGDPNGIRTLETGKWRPGPDSNHPQPPDYKSGALSSSVAQSGSA